MSLRFRVESGRRVVISALAAWFAVWALLFTCIVHAQPDFSRKTGETVADRPNDDYRFVSLRMDSADAQRHYRIRVAIPKAAAPKGGFPIVYMLDGNAALMEVDAALLARLAAQPSPPVLAFVGYDNDLRIDVAGRVYDYTPKRNADAADEFDPIDPSRRTGGADAFLTLLRGSIMPAVEGLATVDPARRTLWGHSYGGLFVLHALFERPLLFQRYVAVDPSLWWGDGCLLHEADAFVAAGRTPPVRTSLVLVTGRGGRPGGMRGQVGDQPEQQGQGVMPAGAASESTGLIAKRLADRLRGMPMQVDYRQLDDVPHGKTLGASLAPMLERASQ